MIHKKDHQAIQDQELEVTGLMSSAKYYEVYVIFLKNGIISLGRLCSEMRLHPRSYSHI